MARYHFHVCDGRDVLDEDGSELPDLEAARRAAAQIAGEMLAQYPNGFWQHGEWSIRVTDDSGLALFDILIHWAEAPSIRDV